MSSAAWMQPRNEDGDELARAPAPTGLVPVVKRMQRQKQHAIRPEPFGSNRRENSLTLLQAGSGGLRSR